MLPYRIQRANRNELCLIRHKEQALEKNSQVKLLLCKGAGCSTNALAEEVWW